MKNKEIKLSLIVIAVLLTGFFIWYFTGDRRLNNNTIKGSIASAEMYTDKVSPEMKEFETKVISDEEYRENLMFSLTYLDVRATELMSVCRMALEALRDMNASDDIKKSMEEALSVSMEVSQTTGKAVDAYTLVLNGERNTRYEEFSNEAVKSLIRLEKYNGIGKQFVFFADDFFGKGNDVEDYMQLAFTADRWANYLAMEAFLNENSANKAKWSEREGLLSPEQYRMAYKSCTSDVRKNIFCSQAMNTFISGNYCSNNDIMTNISGNDRAVVVSNAICATQEQVNTLFINRSGWTVFVMDNGKFEKVCVVSDTNMLAKKRRNGNAKFSDLVSNSEPFTLSGTINNVTLRKAIEII